MNRRSFFRGLFAGACLGLARAVMPTALVQPRPIVAHYSYLNDVISKLLAQGLSSLRNNAALPRLVIRSMEREMKP